MNWIQSVVPSSDAEAPQETPATSSVKSSDPAPKRKAKKVIVSDEVGVLNHLFGTTSELSAGNGGWRVP